MPKSLISGSFDAPLEILILLHTEPGEWFVLILFVPGLGTRSDFCKTETKRNFKK